MDFDIYELKIVLSTNIKSKKELLLTSDLIYNTEEGFSIGSELNKYPFFTSDVMYSRSRLVWLTYQERINFFFDQKKYKELLASYKMPTPEKKDRNSVVEHNIMVMLELILPTKFPAVKDLKESYKIVLNKDGFTDHLYEAGLIKQPFSYLKINGKVYTTKRVIWLNDILNHPVYEKLIDQYRKFSAWCKEEKENAEIIIKKSISILSLDINNYIETIIKLINTYVSENPQKKYYLTSASTIEKSRKISTTIKGLLVLYKIKILSDILNNNDNINLELKDAILNKQLDKLLKNTDIEVNKLLSDVKMDKKIIIMEQITKMITHYEDNEPEIEELDVSKFLYLDSGITTYKPIDLNDTSKNSSQINNLLNEIKPFYSKITNNKLNSELSSLNLLNYMFELPYEEVQKKYNDLDKPIPPVYRNFFYSTLSQDYRRPYRESTNALLQDIIDCKTESQVKDFFSFMEKIYKFYLKNNAEYKLSKQERTLLRVDMNYININQSIGVKREIHVMVDFIEGEVNEKNINDIYCPFYGQHLGNEFDYLFRMFYYGIKVQDWDVTKSRMMFSLEKMSMENARISGDKKYEIVGKPLEKQRELLENPRENQKNPKIQQKKVETPERMNGLFLDKIVNNNKLIKDQMSEINKISRGEQIYDTNILDHIKKNNSDLYNNIKKWSEKEFERSDKLLSELFREEGKYGGTLKDLNFQKEKYDNTFDDETKYKINYKIELNKLYNLIVKSLNENESNKNITRLKLGGSKRKKKNKNKTKNKTKKKHLYM